MKRNRESNDILRTYQILKFKRRKNMINNATCLKKRNNKKGFTLIELVVVIAILGILAAIAIPRLTGSRDKAKINADIATARTIAGAVSIAEAEGTIVVVTAGQPTVAELVTAGYLAKAPKSAQDPNGGDFTIAYTAAWDISTIKVPAGTQQTVYPAP